MHACTHTDQAHNARARLPLNSWQRKSAHLGSPGSLTSSLALEARSFAITRSRAIGASSSIPSSSSSVLSVYHLWHSPHPETATSQFSVGQQRPHRYQTRTRTSQAKCSREERSSSHARATRGTPPSAPSSPHAPATASGRHADTQCNGGKGIDAQGQVCGRMWIGVASTKDNINYIMIIFIHGTIPKLVPRTLLHDEDPHHLLYHVLQNTHHSKLFHQRPSRRAIHKSPFVILVNGGVTPTPPLHCFH